jgi:hypothetical protein
VTGDGASFRGETVGAGSKPGPVVELRAGRLTAVAYGPMMRLCGGAKGDKAPLSVIMTIATADDACRLYAKRFWIETFFSDQKRRGVAPH